MMQDFRVIKALASLCLYNLKALHHWAIIINSCIYSIYYGKSRILTSKYVTFLKFSNPRNHYICLHEILNINVLSSGTALACKKFQMRDHRRIIYFTFEYSLFMFIYSTFKWPFCFPIIYDILYMT